MFKVHSSSWYDNIQLNTGLINCKKEHICYNKSLIFEYVCYTWTITSVMYRLYCTVNEALWRYYTDQVIQYDTGQCYTGVYKLYL